MRLKSILQTSTCATNEQVLTIKDLQEAMNNLPDPPTVYAMDFKIVLNDMLPPNTLVISKDIADEMEKLKEKK